LSSTTSGILWRCSSSLVSRSSHDTVWQSIYCSRLAFLSSKYTNGMTNTPNTMYTQKMTLAMVFSVFPDHVDAWEADLRGDWTRDRSVLVIEESFGQNARGMMHVVQELSFTGEPTFSICDFLCSSMPQAAVHAVDNPYPLAWSTIQADRTYIRVHSGYDLKPQLRPQRSRLRNRHRRALFFNPQRMRSLYQKFRPVNQESR
jgi:hypothetical protein